MPESEPDVRGELSAAFPSVDPDSAILLMWVSRLGRLTELFRTRAASVDLSLDASSHAVLGALLFVGPPHRLSPTFLSRHVVQTSGGMTKTLRRLERDGLVTRVPDERDGRVSYVQLSPEGERVVQSTMSELFKEWQDALQERGVDIATATQTVVAMVEAVEDITGYQRDASL